MSTPSTLPVLEPEALEAAEATLRAAGCTTLMGTVVDMGGVLRAKNVPIARLASFHRSGMGASPTWNVFCIDNGIAFTDSLGVAGDLRLRADVATARGLGGGLAWCPTEFFGQDGTPSPLSPRGRLRATTARAEDAGLGVLVGCELEFVVEPAAGPAVTPAEDWKAYGVGPVLDQEAFVQDFVAAGEAAGLPLEQIHAEYGLHQYEISLAPRHPLAAADDVVLARLLLCRVARGHGLKVSFSPLPFDGGSGNGAHAHISFTRDGLPLLSGGPGPHGLTPEGGSAIAGVQRHLPELLGVFAGSVLSPARLQPGHWSGAVACWGLENREAAIRFCAATPGNPHGASVELKCVDPSANPYLAIAALLGSALAGIDDALPLPPEVPGDPAALGPEGLRAAGAAPLPTGQAEVLKALEASDAARELLGPDILEALLAVRRHELTTYGHAELAELTERFRYAWSA